MDKPSLIEACIERFWAQYSLVTVGQSYEAIDKTVQTADNALAKYEPELFRKFLAVVGGGYACNTEKSDLGWIDRFLRFQHD